MPQVSIRAKETIVYAEVIDVSDDELKVLLQRAKQEKVTASELWLSLRAAKKGCLRDIKIEVMD
jgi:hypothetical protein